MFRFLFILWLVLPQSQGATQLYINYVAPFLQKHEHEINDFISNLNHRVYALSTEYLDKFLYWLKTYGWKFVSQLTGGMVNGPPPEQQQHQQPPFAQNTGNNQGKSSIFGAGTNFALNTLFNKNSTSSTRSNDNPPPYSREEGSSSSFLDGFFDKFKNPPSFATAGSTASSSSSHPSTNVGSFSSNNNNNNTTTTTHSVFWNSILEPLARTGAAAIQTSLHLPKVSPASYQQAYINNPIIATTSSRSVSGAATTTNNSSNVATATGSFISASSSPNPGTSSRFRSVSSGNNNNNNQQHDNGYLNVEKRNSSNSSLSASDLDFDFIRYDGASVGSSQQYPIDSNTINTNVQQQQQPFNGDPDITPNVWSTNTSSSDTPTPTTNIGDEESKSRRSSWFTWNKSN